MNDADFVYWFVRGLLGLFIALQAFLALRMWNRVNDETPKEIAKLRDEVLSSLDTYATKSTVIQMERRVDEKLNNADKQRMEFHADNTKKLDDIVNTTRAIYQQAIDMGVVKERLDQVTKDIADLRRFKHEKVEPYIRALDVQRNEIDHLQKAIARRPTMRTRSDD